MSACGFAIRYCQRCGIDILHIPTHAPAHDVHRHGLLSCVCVWFAYTLWRFASFGYCQVGNQTTDALFWGRPEDITMARPYYLATPDHISDLAGATSAPLCVVQVGE